MKTTGNSSILTVDQMTAVVRGAILRESSLQDLSVRGELLGFKRHTSGHVYFTLQGKSSRVSCVLFRSYASSVLVWPKDGDEVLVRGRVDLYGARGSYQIYVAALYPIGAGAKARAKEALRKRLEAEGLFDPRLKRPLPRCPRRVAVITSPTGAALQDIIRISSIRFPCTDLIIIPSLMQGTGAPDEIVHAFELARIARGISCIILARGGGSRDDLDVFDDERVVRAVRLAPVPVITGLGHQIDTTLADMAADAAAPTPSGAAERLFPDRAAIDTALANVAHHMRGRLEARIAFMRENLAQAAERLDRSIMAGYMKPAAENVDRVSDSLTKLISQRIRDESARLASCAARLANLSPLTLLAKGYSICTDGAGASVRSVNALHAGDEVNIIMCDGRVKAAVEEISVGAPCSEAE